MVERPLGELLRARFDDDLVRGTVGTDALIGTFAGQDDPSLVQNRCFLYHLIGNGTGEWRVPVGGMGAVTDALATAARDAGAEVLTGALVTGIRSGATGCEVSWTQGGASYVVESGVALANVAPWVLSDLMGAPAVGTRPAGSQLKINFLLDRLPRLRSGDDPAAAFAGTFHVAEGYAELETVVRRSSRWPHPRHDRPVSSTATPSPIPRSSGRALAGTGVQTLTYFGLHMPAALFEDPAGREAARRYRSRSVPMATRSTRCLAEPLMDCVLRGSGLAAPAWRPRSRRMSRPTSPCRAGTSFTVTWPGPGPPTVEVLDTPAQRWGVATE